LPDDAQLFVSLVSITVFPPSAQASKKYVPARPRPSCSRATG
jgi:hypothetical protein